MNKNFLEHYMKTKPETMEQKYLFLVDDQELAFAVIALFVILNVFVAVVVAL